MELTPGAVLAGRYRLERKVGEGGMGAVWLAKSLSVGTEVAVKTLTLDASANSEIVMRFRREAYLLACVHSDHVCRVLDFASDERYGHLLVLDFIRGQSLAERLSARPLSVEEALEIGTDVARGMIDLHRASIVHRDLKPGNILLEPRQDGRHRALIVDFGLGRRMRPETDDQQSGITSMDTALGTLEYMAPEQIVNSRGANPSADIYSLGAILYRAVSGRHLFGDLQGAPLAQAKLGQEPPRLVTGRTDPVAAGFEAIVNGTLRRKPAERYATTEQVLADLLKLHRVRDEWANPPAAPISAPIPIAASPVVSAPPLPLPPPPQVRQGVSGVAVLFIAIGAIIGGAVVGAYAERLRMAEASSKGAPSASAAASAEPPSKPPGTAVAVEPRGGAE